MWMLGHGSQVTSEVIKEFNAQSARTTAIVGAAIIEDALHRIIASRLPNDGRTKEDLFKPQGPIGNLDSKIKIAYAMGIISKDALHDLTKVQEVRNMFAHRLDVADFDHALVRPKCFEFRLIERHLFRYGEMPDDEYPSTLGVTMSVQNLDEQLADARGRYFLSVMLLHSIDNYVPHPDNPKPRPPRAFL